MTRFDYDLMVIGGGSGGVRAAKLAAGHKARVALAEESRMGGTCVIRGCVPKKLYVYAGRFAGDFKLAESFGWTVGRPSFDWPALVAAKNNETARLEALYRKGLADAGVTVFDQRAVLEGPHEVRLDDGRPIHADKILIASGARARRDFGGAGAEHCIASDEAFDLPELPGRIVIMGGGYIAVEFAHIFNALGSNVTVVYRGPKVLRGFDEDIRDALMESMARRGIRVLTGSVLKRVEQVSSSLCAETDRGEVLDADRIMLALGRTPNTQGLGLACAGVTTGPDGRIEVLERLESSDLRQQRVLEAALGRCGRTTAGHLFAMLETLRDLGPSRIKRVIEVRRSQWAT